MKFTPASFRAWDRKRITLLGMSGVGKTYLSCLLRRHHWFHYSGDYRIGKRYLDEPILDLIKQQAMQVPFLKDLLRNDWIDIRNNIKIQDLGPVLSYVGKLGNPDHAGLSLPEFSHRQARYREADALSRLGKQADACLVIAATKTRYSDFGNGDYCRKFTDLAAQICGRQTPTVPIKP